MLYTFMTRIIWRGQCVYHKTCSARRAAFPYESKKNNNTKQIRT